MVSRKEVPVRTTLQTPSVTQRSRFFGNAWQRSVHRQPHLLIISDKLQFFKKKGKNEKEKQEKPEKQNNLYGCYGLVRL